MSNEVENTEEETVDLKLVATTLIWTNSGSEDLPMWKATGGKEYIIARLDHHPTFEEVGEIVNNNAHLVETHTKDFHETLSGWMVCFDKEPTSGERMQMHLTEYVEFPPIDLTNLDEENAEAA